MLNNIKSIYCTVFFMVLDLRLAMKIGCRDDNLFFFQAVCTFLSFRMFLRFRNNITFVN